MDDIWLPNGFFGYSYPISNVYSRKNRLLKTNILPPGLVLFDTFANLGSFYINNNKSQTISGLNSEPKFAFMFGALNSGDNSIESKLNFNIGMATSSGNRAVKYMSALNNAVYSYASIGGTITGFIKQNDFNSSQNRFDKTFLAVNPTGFNNDSLDMLVYNTGSVDRNMNYLIFGGSGISAFITGVNFSSALKYSKIRHGLSGLPTTLLISANTISSSVENNFTTWLRYTFGVADFKNNQFSIGVNSRGSITPNDARTASTNNAIFFNNNNTSPVTNNISILSIDDEYIYFMGSGSNSPAVIDIACIMGIVSDIGQYQFTGSNQTITIPCDNRPESILIASTPNSYNRNYLVNNNTHFNLTTATQNKTISCGFIDIDNLSTSKVYSYQYDSFVEFNPSGNNAFSGDISFNDSSVSLNSRYLESGYGQGFYMIHSKPEIIPYLQEIYSENFETNNSGDFQSSGNNQWTIVDNTTFPHNARTGLVDNGLYSLYLSPNSIPPNQDAGVVLVKNMNKQGIFYFDMIGFSSSLSSAKLAVYVNNTLYWLFQGASSFNDQKNTYVIPLNSGENIIFFNHNQIDVNNRQSIVYIDNIRIKEIQTE